MTKIYEQSAFFLITLQNIYEIINLIVNQNRTDIEKCVSAIQVYHIMFIPVLSGRWHHCTVVVYILETFPPAL